MSTFFQPTIRFSRMNLNERQIAVAGPARVAKIFVAIQLPVAVQVGDQSHLGAVRSARQVDRHLPRDIDRKLVEVGRIEDSVHVLERNGRAVERAHVQRRGGRGARILWCGRDDDRTRRDGDGVGADVVAVPPPHLDKVLAGFQVLNEGSSD
jgi:hypothetical protein